jgi:GR25 family glycosyltransferase involved in LPS biosynthesis
MNLTNYFSKAYVINLDVCPERWGRFQKCADHYGITGFERYRAIEGDKCPHPHWWRAGNGAWGCMMTHFRLAQDAILDGLDNYLVLEDDACFSDDFTERLPKLMEEVDTLDGDWDILYLGGQHLYRETSPPWPYNGSNHLLRCNNVNRTHALAINARFMVKFSQHIIHAPDYIESKDPMHIDHQLGNLHRDIKTLAANPWLCGQAAGQSNVNGQKKGEEWWNDNGWGKDSL